MDWHHVGPDPAQGTGGWLSPAPAGADSARGAPSTTLSEYVVRSSEMTRVGRIITLGRTKSGSRPDSEQSGIAFPLPRVVGSGTLWSRQITTSTNMLTALISQLSPKPMAKAKSIPYVNRQTTLAGNTSYVTPHHNPRYNRS
ncbi:hypothetical protein TIFTF001_042049 [Ficus carica]|uniref:Uncharacterized protein n=1 Tax=Ficus carica TaxID=3494 RepID=A0AA88CXM7_FICCA|nr:hypothetical protein TIFTF001_042030 [Ficus carica]GMN34359.1 hypothetical protein TIFTF001_042032 [Ficus carica]GMN34394.1 hypothetical protein TIFTF001_042047 [Ficus carica]GMN34436.1 hypothetical protein TIFTF001_042049 [Ficus carica]